MDNKLREIIIGFKYNSDYIKELPVNDQEYIKSEHVFTVDSQEYLIRDLLIEILMHIENDEYKSFDDTYLWSRFYGFIDGEGCELNFDFPALNYYQLNCIDGVAYIIYNVGARGGWGGGITPSVRLYIPSGEKGHERIPHVHIQKGKYKRKESNKNTIRINLLDLSVMDGAKRRIPRLFTKDEWAYIMGITEKYRNSLIRNYYLMQKGGRPENIEIDLDGKSFELGSRKYGYE